MTSVLNRDSQTQNRASGEPSSTTKDESHLSARPSEGRNESNSTPCSVWGPRKAVFFILLLGITYGAYRYMIKPANSDLAEKKAQIEKNLAKLAEFEKATAATKDLSKQLEQLQGAIEFFESKLPPKSEIHKVLEQVTVIAQKQGLKPKTIRTLNKKDNSGTRSPAPRRGGTNAEQSKSGGRYIEQPLKMELVGNFNSFYSFLLELEKLPRIMKIRELKLEKQTRNNGQIAADFVLSVFCQHG